MEYETDNMGDESFLCEEELLTTVFHVCDAECRGKAEVSAIVGYLRRLTGRESEDSDLKELCNVLDPEQKGVSVDLETFRAIMTKWIEDRRRERGGSAFEEPIASVDDLAVRVHEKTTEAKEMPVCMDVTLGGLEAAAGGDVPKGDMETSDLLGHVASLHYKNQQLWEENTKLKLTLEAGDETNRKLLADNDALCHQMKSIQCSVLKAKSLEEELEEAKSVLKLSEETRQKILYQNEQLEKEKKSLTTTVTFLQEENLKSTMDIDRYQKKIVELSENAAELQIQTEFYEKTLESNEASLIQKEERIKDLELTIQECSSIIETLKEEKTQLLENIQHLQQELILNGLSLPSSCRLNSNVTEGNSLHFELELAQSSEVAKTKWTSQDETLDHEALFLRQGPELKTVMRSLVSDGAYQEEASTLEDLWIQKLRILERHKDSLEKDFIQTVNDLRITKTEQFLMRKKLSARGRLGAEVQEQPCKEEGISDKGKYSSKWNLESRFNFKPAGLAHIKSSFSKANKSLWVSVSILILLVALTSFLTGLSLQRPADAAPVRTGNCWTLVQQFLCRYTRLQHYGPPPI